jgi:hypothetical protein
MCLALADLLALVSCNRDLSPLHESRTIMTPGGVCGHWKETKGATTTLVDATCGEGLFCTGIAYYAVLPPGDLGGRDFETCLPANAHDCDKQSNACPEQFGCVVGFGLPSTGACIHTCSAHADCPDSYQLCDSGACTVLPCGDSDAGGGCWEGTHCQDRICRPD